MSIRVSVILPFFNSEATLGRAARSILTQSFEDLELVAVDDGSEDQSAARLEALGDPRVRLVRSEVNQGRGRARQLGLAAARGELIAFQDADDWSLSSRLERQVTYLDANPDVSLVDTAMAVVLPSRSEPCLAGVDGPHSTLPERFTLNAVGTMPVRFATSMLRREATAALAFDTRFRRSEDFDFVTRFLMGRTYARLPSVEYVYHREATLRLRTYLASSVYRAAAAAKHLREHPTSALRVATTSLLKAPVHTAIFLSGRGERFAARHLRPLSVSERRRVLRALESLEST